MIKLLNSAKSLCNHFCAFIIGFGSVFNLFGIVPKYNRDMNYSTQEDIKKVLKDLRPQK